MPLGGTRASPVSVAMMQVREMGMLMCHGPVFVQMAVGFSERIIRAVLMAMMLIVNMAMLMLQSQMTVFVLMTLS